ncbi:S1C family serine protease [Butyrivibrio sp. MC2013]|uniref:S1C family serine protease n=1 Tax=Butyrivibrio sp. MC2013 TaxID=1280686 RepID=UPI000411B4B8|nr:PDZ domain-containing protein [Butyrivibrio sp. MC2013]
MSDNKDPYNNRNLANSEPQTDESGAPLANTDFMREKIKSRPINSRKLIRRTLITISMAVLFGLVACCTFLLLQPMINNALNPGDSASELVSFPEEIVDEEIQRDDLIASEEEKAAADAAMVEASVQASVTQTAEKELKEALNSLTLSASDYSSMYSSLKEIAVDGQKSMVNVTGITEDTDWISNSIIRSNSSSGLIVASTKNDILILVSSSRIKDFEKITVTFCNGKISDATMKSIDPLTGLCIVSVDSSNLDEDTLSAIKTATLGSSASSTLVGYPVIALGSPTGSEGSISYGFVTSGKKTIDLPDSAYQLLTTDIYGSSAASGVLINLTGSVIGVIDMNYNDEDQDYLLSAIGITELRGIIGNLSNDIKNPYLGVHGSDIPETLLETYPDMPKGVYVSKIDMDSPAMEAGIQSGDIIVGIDDQDVERVSSYLTDLSLHAPGDSVNIAIMRQGPDGYMEITVSAELKTAPGL